MDILISFAEKIADYTVAPIGRQVGYLIFYKENFKELEFQVQELEGVRDQIMHSIEEERRNGREIEGVVQNWLIKVDEITNEANQLGTDPRQRNVRCSKWSFPNIRSRHQLSRKAKKMVENVAEVQRKGKFDRLGYLPPLDVVGSTSTLRGSEKLESRKSIKQEIMSALRDPKISRIGVYGLSGVGKTTLVEQVAEQVKEENLFEAVAMAHVSHTPDLERIQGEIADFLGLHFEETTTLGRARRLCERIKKEKSILIILDDIWARLDLEKLKIPSEFGDTGCKLLLTSRNQDILQDMETQRNFKLDVLNEEETWYLFEDLAGDVVKDASLHGIATQVAKKCAGLTVLVVTVARALKNKDINHWTDALNQLQTVANEGMNELVYSALEFSYNHLKGDEMKALFLLCGVFYSDSPLDAELLFRHFMGLGIFKHVSILEDARCRFYKLIDSLKASCLLLETNTNMEVKMHDIVAEVARSIASRDQHVLKVGAGVELKWPTEDLLQRCTCIILQQCYIHKLPKRLECPNVKFFYLRSTNHSLGIPDSFFETMRNLKVLDLSRMHLSSLPISFYALTSLQTLCLHNCALGDMTNIGALKNLQILSLYGSSMLRLPSELGQLTLLKMLDLTNSGIETIPSNIILKLTDLEELFMNASIKWEQENSAQENRNAALTELRHLKKLTTLAIQIQEASFLPRDLMFEKLKGYKIVIGEWEWSHNYGVKKILKLKLGSTNIHLEHGIKELVKGVEDLYLDEMNGISNVLYDLNGEGFPLIMHLKIQNNVEIQHIVNSMERNQAIALFPNLETLTLQNLYNLEKICHGPLMVNSFGMLRVLKVKSCDRLKYLFSVSMVKALSCLLEIEVSECSSMKKIVFVESIAIDDKIEFHSLCSLTLRHLPIFDDFCSNEVTSSITTKQNALRTNIPTSFFNAKVHFSNLESLKLSSIKLEKIWDDDQPSITYSICNLVNLNVEECDGLKYLVSLSMIGSLSNLKRLEVSKCDIMEEMIATTERNGAALGEARFPKLETIIISNMKSLKKVWHSQFEGLETLEVNSCEKLENIFPSYMQRTFGSLETLKVSDCGSMERIFELTANDIHTKEVGTTQLKRLHILNLPKLKQIWSKDPQGILRFNNLQDMHVECCGNIEFLFPFSIAMDLLQLEKLCIGECGMKEIVAKKEGHMEGKAIFDFQRLYNLGIWNMQELYRFYAGNHILACPSLRVLEVIHCAKLELFETRSRSNRRKNSIDKTHVSMQQPLFIVEEVIPNLEKLNLSNKDAITILQDQQWRDYFRKLKLLRLYGFDDKQAKFFLDSVLQNAPNLEGLVVRDSSLEEIFQHERIARKEGKNQISTLVKRLALSNLQELQHICREGFQFELILEVLEGLYVADCASLKNLVPSFVTFSHLTDLLIEKCNRMTSLISSSTARSLVKLESMIIKECNLLEEMVTQEVNETKDEIVFSSLVALELEHLPRFNSFSCSKCCLKFPLLKRFVVRQCPMMKIFSAKETSTPMLRKVLKGENDEDWCWEGGLNRTIEKMFQDSNSKTLKLSSIKLEKIWDDDQLSVANSFRNLVNLTVEECGGLKYLFSSSMIENLLNLKRLEISRCDIMEEIIVTMEPNGAAVEEVRFSKLETIIISNMKCLNKVWHPQFEGLKTLEVNNCEKLENIFPSHMQRTFGSLETLKVSDCSLMEEIFELTTTEIQNEEFTTAQQKKLHLRNLPKLKQIWSKDPKGILRFNNLQDVQVELCGNIEFLFPFSIAMDLPQLEKLHMNECGMKEIVAKKEGHMQGKAVFDFHQLYHLAIWNMKELEKFYAENHILACPSLRVLEFINCAKLELFNTRSTSNKREISDSKTFVSMQQPLFIADEVIPSLEELNLDDNKDAIMILQDQKCGGHFKKLKLLRLYDFHDKQIETFLDSILQNAPNLEGLVVRDSILKEIFQDERLACKESKNEISTQLKRLGLLNLQELQHICREGRQIDPILEFLETLYVGDCASLKNLVPSSVTFDHLIVLEIRNCNGLTSLISSSTARSFTKLESMIVKECNSLEEILTHEVDEMKDEIVFSNLRILELQCLPRLNCFSCSQCFFKFPLLKRVAVRQCPKMKFFSARETSTPMLRKVLKEGKDDEWCWEGDLNATIEKMFQDKAIQEGDGENYMESSSNVSDQPHQRSTSTNKASISKEHEEQSKPDQIVDTWKQGIHKLPSLSHEREQKEQAMSAHPLIPADQERFLPEAIQNALSPTTVQDVAIDPTRPQAPGAITTSRQASYVDTGKQENYKLPSLSCERGQKEEQASWADTTSIPVDHERILSQAIQNALNPATILDAAIDPSPSQAQVTTSSIPALDASCSYKGMIDSFIQNLPYLEAGVKRHPQVLDWLNTKQRRVFASLFAEVTRLLRTTRRGDLTEDDRNYIRECCSCLEVVGFDASWLSYVNGCIEECGDGENLRRRLEEAEDEASTLKAQLDAIKKKLASAEASLDFLRDKTSRLDNFIES